MKQRGAMEDSMWRKMFLFFILQFTGALSKNLSLSYTVRAGDDVTLSCENVIDGHSNCNTTTWIYSKSGRTVELVGHGKVKNIRSDRLSVSPNCSLVVKNVTDEDVGLYTCRQFIKPGGNQSGPDASARLSLVRLTEHEDQSKVTLTCSVEADEPCKHSVKWLFSGNNMDKDNKDVTESSSSCSSAVTFQTSNYIYQSKFNLFKCEVKTGNKVQLFTFSSRPSGFPWWYIILPLVLVAIITVVVLLMLKRTKGNRTKNSCDVPAETQCASEYQQQEVGPENGVFYVSISYTKKSNSSRDKNDDECEAVTYSTVKAPAIDPSSLYASIK